MTTRYEQTWDTLAEALDEIVYLRDPLPDGRQRFTLHRDDDANYARLGILTYTPNYYRPGRMRLTGHEAVVPVATYDKANWTRWVFERLKAIETHELCEAFLVAGERPYPPMHGNGEDPYVEWHLTDAQRAAKAPGA